MVLARSVVGRVPSALSLLAAVVPRALAAVVPAVLAAVVPRALAAVVPAVLAAEVPAALAAEVPAALAAEVPAALAAEGTLVVGLAVDRDGARLIAFTRKARADRGAAASGDAAGDVRTAEVLEATLTAAGGAAAVRSVPLRGLCLEHGPDSAPHVAGDTIRVHHDTLTVEFPDLPGAAAVKVTRPGPAGPVALGAVLLDPARFVVTEGPLPAAPAAPSVPEAPLGTVHWPEAYGETERYKVFGDEAETARRINVVLVPDGYTHAQKALLEEHAANVVAHFRQKTPFKEHDPFYNYTLVYAYSNQDGTDQCDCAVRRDTAMNTRFPNAGGPCEDSANRCLYYGWGCDPANWTDANIVAAELRAPAKDVTLVMVNTARYGGCGGARAVYAAGSASAAEIAVHELGHALAGLADEYDTESACGTTAGEINTSRNAATGAWPEWIAEVGPPTQGAEYYSRCLYRPESTCEMRTLSTPFCRVCNQHWSLRTYGHPRVADSAPIAGSAPASPVATQVGRTVGFDVQTRLSLDPAVHEIRWTRQGPADPAPVTVAQGTPSYAASFAEPGEHTVRCEVTADTNFVKPERTGSNRDIATWTVQAAAIPEVGAAPADLLRVARRADGRLALTFGDVGASRYNVYVSNRPGTHPFKVASPAEGKRDCNVPFAAAGAGQLRIESYDAEAGIVGPRGALFLLVTADNGPPTECSLGADGAGQARVSDAACAR